MDYRPDTSRYDRSGAPRSKMQRRTFNETRELPLGKSLDLSSLTSMPGFTQFARESSLLDSSQSFDFTRRAGSSMQREASYGLTSDPGLVMPMDRPRYDMAEDLAPGNQGMNFRPSGSLGSQYGGRKRTLPESFDQSDYNIRLASEVQKHTGKKVDVNKILKVMRIVDRLEEMEGSQNVDSFDLERGSLGRQRDQQQLEASGALRNTDMRMSQNLRYDSMESDFDVPDQTMGMESMRPGRIVPGNRPVRMGGNLARNGNSLNRGQGSIGRGQSMGGMQMEMGRQMDMEGRQMDMGGRQMDLGQRQMDMEARQMMGGRQMDLGGRQMDMGGRQMDMGGRQMDLGGRQMDTGGRQMNLKERQMIGGRQMDRRGRQMDMGGRQMDRRGRQVDLDGRQMDVDRKQINIDNRQLNRDGSLMNMGGRQMNMRGVDQMNMRGNGQMHMRGGGQMNMRGGGQMNMRGGGQMNMRGGPAMVNEQVMGPRMRGSGQGNPQEMMGNPGLRTWGTGMQQQGRQWIGQDNMSGSQMINKWGPSGAFHGLSPEQVKNMPLSERFKLFISFLKTEDLTKNSINLLDCAFDRSKLHLRKDFKCEHFVTIGDKFMHSACLTVNGHFLARTYGRFRKDVKYDCYEKAIHILMNKPVEEILQLKDPGTEKVAEELLEKYKKEGGSSDEETKGEKEIEEDGKEKVLKFRSVREELNKLVGFLKKGNPSRQDVLTYLEKAIQESCKLSYRYTHEEVQYKKRPWFIGYFELHDSIIAAAGGLSKESAKKNTYEQAVKFLKVSSLFMITDGVTVDKRKLMPAVETVTEQLDRPNPKTEGNIKLFIEALSKLAPDSVTITRFKERVKGLNLILLTLSRRTSTLEGKSVINCDMFLDNIYIATGTGNNKKDAEEKLYQEAFVVCTSSSADVIYNDFKRLSAEDTDEIFEAIEFSTNLNIRTEYYNNFGRMKSYRYLFKWMEEKGEEVPTDYNAKDRDNIILFENSEWSSSRYNKAFEILQLSTQMNQMALHYEFAYKKGVCRCRLFLHFELVAEAVAPKKEMARLRAAAACLFQLYQTQTTIRVIQGNDEQTWVKYDTLLERAQKLKEEMGDTGTDEDDEIEVQYPLRLRDKPKAGVEVVEEKESTAEDDSSMATMKVNKWVLKVIESMIKEQAEKETIQELIFGPGGPTGFMQHVRMIANKHGLHGNLKIFKSLYYLVVRNMYTADKILQILRKNGGQSGKLLVLSRSNLPKPSELPAIQASIERSQNPRYQALKQGGKLQAGNMKKRKKRPFKLTS